MIRVGISGWNYAPWRGVFYPPGLVHRRELEYASHSFDSIEINGSFYSLLRPTSVLRWCEQAPSGFLFSIKGSRFITHMKRLKNFDAALANFFASGVLAFEDKLGPILWQLPASIKFELDRFAPFFEALPRTTGEALALAQRHDDRLVDDRIYLQTADPHRPLRYALEPRHPSFGDAAAIELLRRHNIAMCVADTAGVFPQFDTMTTDFVYVRLHGDAKLYESGYSRASLTRWAERIEQFEGGGHDVYVYFDNDARVRAPFDAKTLRSLLRGTPVKRHPQNLRGAGEPARVDWPGFEMRKR